MPAKNKIRKLTVPTRPRVEANDEKLMELVVLLARRSEGDPWFGAMKLNKLLFYADFLSYLTLGKPITGQEYFALENGPALRYKARLWETMTQRGDIVVRKQPTVMNTDKETTLALREPDVSKFTPEELNLVYVILDASRDKRGTDLSLMSHTFRGWILAKEKETIPYSAVLVGDRKPTHNEIRRGLELESSLIPALA